MTSWRGCGLHVPGVFQSVPSDKRCTCGPKIERNVGGQKLEFPPRSGEGRATSEGQGGAADEGEQNDGEVKMWGEGK